MRFLCKLCLAILLNNCFSQGITGNVEYYLNNYLSSLSNIPQNEFVQPTNNQLNDWNTLIVNVLNSNFLVADDIANQLNYSVIYFDDTVTNTSHIILQEKTPKVNYWGLTIFNFNSCRNKLVLQAPHPIKDYNTGKQAAFTYLKTNAFALMLSGTNRCNHSALSVCDGSTSVCSGLSSSYTISDVAHNTQSVFQQTTSTLYNEITGSLFIQLHGFTKTSSDPYLIASNGNHKFPTIDYILSLTNELNIIDSSISYKIPHIDTSWNRLIGSTNVQGRLINGSINPCNSAPTQNTGRFIHLEQEKNKLRLDSVGWHKMSEAIKKAISCETNYLPINLKKNNIKVYPNPINNSLHILHETDIESVEVFNTQGKLIKVFGASKNIDLSSINKGVYYLKIHSEKTIFTQRIIKN